MNNPVSKFFFAAAFIYVLMISSAWAQRVLIDDALQTVSVANNFSCYSPADITIDTVSPDMYESNTEQLQTLGDSIKAMLSYECPQLSSIRLTGLIRGLDEIVYQGEMNRNSNWLLQPVVSGDLSGSQNGSRSDETQTLKRYDDELSRGQLEVTGLNLGMSVDQVAGIVQQTFGVEPEYDIENGLMTMSSAGCPADFDSSHTDGDIQPDWKCLKAWFSDNRIARLERLNLIQVSEGRPGQVSNLLVEKYGDPIEAKSGQVSDTRQMIWRAINDKLADSSIEEIDALITVSDANLVITELSLYSTEAAAQSANEDYADLDLKL